MFFFSFDFSPFVRHTFWSCQVIGMTFVTSVLGFSQSAYMRFISVKDLKKAEMYISFNFVYIENLEVKQLILDRFPLIALIANGFSFLLSNWLRIC